ncbi:bestrophin-like domain [Ensifer sp. MJa1]|uniref:bestrophin-like domain n=1 Tax=Ensifer sp. MJa1 TaxID=2919888 RepID=UPI00300B591B
MIVEILLGALFIFGTVALTLAAYFLMRLIMGSEAEGHEKELASSIIFRVAALHGLILALVFAQEMVEYQQLKYTMAIEAGAIADIYFDAGRYGETYKAPIEQAISAYAAEVIDGEWQSLGDKGRLSQQAWVYWDAAYQHVLNLVPVNKRQESLRSQMLERLHDISQSRTKRESNVADSIDSIFWFAALAGVIFIALAYYSFPPMPRNLLLLCLFGAYTGIILFLIYAFSNPYQPPAALAPGPLERVQQQISASTSATGG